MLRSSFPSLRLPKCLHPNVISHHVRPIFTAADTFSPEALEAASKDPNFPIIVSEDGTHALRKRRHSNRPLPLPPHMDPVRRAQRNQFKDRKKQPDEVVEFTDFQKRMQDNVYAQALATPVRQCRLTHARLPSFFLLPLAIAPVPQSEEPKMRTTQQALLPIDLFAQANAGNEELRTMLPRVKRRAYATLHKTKLDYVTEKKKWGTLTDPAMHAYLQKFGGREQLEWRKDMSDFVRDMLRRIVTRDLRSLIERPLDAGSAADNSLEANSEPKTLNGADEPLVACPSGATGLHRVSNAACILYFVPLLSSERATIEKQVERAAEKADAEVNKLGALLRKYDKSESLPHMRLSVMLPQLNTAIKRPPLDFPSAEYQDGKVPVYGLAGLLGEEEMRKVIEGTKFEGERCLVLKQGAESLRLQKSLLKLQIYLAEA
ncbi:hypothetical protein NA57DRAFT_77953 [Rhizodiscina lignyota]|uniref:Uncharacterized protein n=1 Tax=Rhizodiscina lignyota TaxID=1504668 RepID=A0A9P4IA98_9PEZI|nr:hypothetical protein NA57DRAFT_77953 [Rhizodiscina lignyota]